MFARYGVPVAAMLVAGLGAWVAWYGGARVQAGEVDPRVLQAEQQRIAVIEKVRPAVVAVFASSGQGGGSGVLIDQEGFALTNYHVTAGAGDVMKCGLADGVLYDAVLVGLDRVGDVALIKLVPKKEGQPFPFVTLGDSDKLRAGDWSLAMGNPFLLATDFTPTVTFGLISGIHRYQPPEGRGLLEYTDCIQIDTSINPGNSGGPLFNLAGELIGINGRGSFDKRGRVNSGVGYAISINQIKNFLGHLYAGLDTDHATLGAAVETESEDGLIARLVVRSILEHSDAHRRGLEPGDELIEFAGRPLTSTNQFKNIVGIFPKGWRLPLTFRHNNEKKEVLVRLMGYLPQEIDDTGRPRPTPTPEPKPKIKPKEPAPPQPDSPALKLLEKKPGYANYYFNRQQRDRLMLAFKRHGDFSPFQGEWGLEGTVDLPRKKGAPFKATVAEEKTTDGKSTRTVVRLEMDGLRYDLEPLKQGQDARTLRQPNGSGGLLMALHVYRQLLLLGEKGFVGQFAHGGHEPFYPPRLDGVPPKSLKDLRADAEVLITEEADITTKWYFALNDHKLLGFEVWIEPNEDPCEVYFYDYKPVDGRQLPQRFVVHYGNERFGTFSVREYRLGKAN